MYENVCENSYCICENECGNVCVRISVEMYM